MSETQAPSMEELTSRPWTVEQAQEYCTNLASRHYENFPVGSLLIPKELRPHVHAIYAFARVADDYADEPDTMESLRLPLLENWESQLIQSVWRKPQHPVFIALKDTMERFDLPRGLFQDLMMAFKLDVIQNRHSTFKDLLYYCRHSANPIGRLVLYLFGYRDPELHSLSDSVCTALQLTNFWQDLLVDLKKNRIYIPKEDMDRFGYSEKDLENRLYNQAFQDLMAYQVDRTRSLFEDGRALHQRVNRSLKFEINLVWQGGTHILNLIESQNFNIFSHRPVLTPRTWVWLGAKSLLVSRF